MTKKRQHYELMERLGGLTTSPKEGDESQALDYAYSLRTLYQAMSKMWEDDFSDDRVLGYLGDHMDNLLNDFIWHASRCDFISLFINADLYSQEVIMSVMLDFDQVHRKGNLNAKLQKQREQQQAWSKFVKTQTDLTADQQCMVTPNYFKNNDEEAWLKWVLISSEKMAA